MAALFSSGSARLEFIQPGCAANSVKYEHAAGRWLATASPSDGGPAQCRASHYDNTSIASGG
jgi:hypothetical protein